MDAASPVPVPVPVVTPATPAVDVDVEKIKLYTGIYHLEVSQNVKNFLDSIRKQIKTAQDITIFKKILYVLGFSNKEDKSKFLSQLLSIGSKNFFTQTNEITKLGLENRKAQELATDQFVHSLTAPREITLTPEERKAVLDIFLHKGEHWSITNTVLGVNYLDDGKDRTWYGQGWRVATSVLNGAESLAGMGLSAGWSVLRSIPDAITVPFTDETWRDIQVVKDVSELYSAADGALIKEIIDVACEDLSPAERTAVVTEFVALGGVLKLLKFPKFAAIFARLKALKMSGSIVKAANIGAVAPAAFMASKSATVVGNLFYWLGRSLFGKPIAEILGIGTGLTAGLAGGLVGALAGATYATGKEVLGILGKLKITSLFKNLKSGTIIYSPNLGQIGVFITENGVILGSIKGLIKLNEKILFNSTSLADFGIKAVLTIVGAGGEIIHSADDLPENIKQDLIDNFPIPPSSAITTTTLAAATPSSPTPASPQASPPPTASRQNGQTTPSSPVDIQVTAAPALPTAEITDITTLINDTNNIDAKNLATTIERYFNKNGSRHALFINLVQEVENLSNQTNQARFYFVLSSLVHENRSEVNNYSDFAFARGLHFVSETNKEIKEILDVEIDGSHLLNDYEIIDVVTQLSSGFQDAKKEGIAKIQTFIEKINTDDPYIYIYKSKQASINLIKSRSEVYGITFDNKNKIDLSVDNLAFLDTPPPPAPTILSEADDIQKTNSPAVAGAMGYLT